jgi:hypothetical protein
MGSGYRVFTAGEVLTASNVQNFLQNQSVMSFADSTARATSIGTANFEEGMVSYLQNTDQLELYNGTAWASIAPTSTQGLTLINSTSFSGVSSQSVNDVFSATYQNYVISISFTGTASNYLALRLRVGGADASGSNYTWGFVAVSTGGTSFVLTGAGQTLSNISRFQNVAASINSAIFTVFRPFEAERTTYHGTTFYDDGATTASPAAIGGQHSLSTSYTGFTLIPGSGNVTGVVRVYGYSN